MFASGSHRDFSLPYWHTLEGMSDLSGRGYEVESYEPLDLGDATAHAGWCLHWSPPQPEDCPPRYALSVCYFVDGATRLAGNCAISTRTYHVTTYIRVCAYVRMYVYLHVTSACYTLREHHPKHPIKRSS